MYFLRLQITMNVSMDGPKLRFLSCYCTLERHTRQKQVCPDPEYQFSSTRILIRVTVFRNNSTNKTTRSPQKCIFIRKLLVYAIGVSNRNSWMFRHSSSIQNVISSCFWVRRKSISNINAPPPLRYNPPILRPPILRHEF